MNTVAIRGQMFFYTGDPFLQGESAHVSYSDGLMIVECGKIKAVGEYNHIKHQVTENMQIVRYSNRYVILPGFLDTHVHYPQIPMVGAYGKHLVDWLNTYTFVFEQKLHNTSTSKCISQYFLREMVRNGVTTAFVFPTVHKTSVESLFEEAGKFHMRIGCGKIVMDRNAPKNLTDTAEISYRESEELIKKWHNKNRAMYVITPRFVPTSSPEQLEAIGALWNKYPTTYMQTHMSETREEVQWVQSLFPERGGYFDVYHHYGLTGPRSIFGHCIHLNDCEWELMSDTDSSVAHCPTSNLFLGSGLFDIRKAYRNKSRPVRVGLGSDLGAGTSFCPLQTLSEAYKVTLLNSCSWLDAYRAFYLVTRGSSKSLHLEDKIGSLQEGMEADFVVLDLESTPALKYRNSFTKDLKEALFVQMTCADDRAIHTTYINGSCVFKKSEQYPNGVFLNKASFLNDLV